MPIMILLICAFVLSCRSQAFMEQSTSRDSVNVKTAQYGAPEDSPSEEEPDHDESAIVPPTMVAGAFLTCERLSTEDSGQGQIGCVIGLEVYNDALKTSTYKKAYDGELEDLSFSVSLNQDQNWHQIDNIEAIGGDNSHVCLTAQDVQKIAAVKLTLGQSYGELPPAIFEMIPIGDVKVESDMDINQAEADPTVGITSITLGENQYFEARGSGPTGTAGYSQDCGNLNQYQPIVQKKSFTVDVQEDITMLELRINQVCGVDSPYTKLVFEDENGYRIGDMPIGLGAKSFSYNFQAIPKSRLKIRIESGELPKSTGSYDSIIFSAIELSADANIHEIK